ncbi:MAG TPA: hypothetical protein VFI27_03945, partial [candidate division Zixibacteria bacterium]|nr:hypothetical protein [candidate division Zixibacteria bacterium]
MDESKVPHYFGPNPNWANSPFTLPDATVEIVNQGNSNGSGAEAVAAVGADGAITAITVTNPGHDYTNVKVNIVGSGTGATAVADIVRKGSVVAVTVEITGTGYTAPSVTFSDGAAAATAYGGVDMIALTNPGSGYAMPTVDFDLPDGPNGVQARGHAECEPTDCAPVTDGGTVTITNVIVDSPGSGYSTAPHVVIRDGTIFDPINHDPDTFTQATATATLSIQSIVLD